MKKPLKENEQEAFRELCNSDGIIIFKSKVKWLKFVNLLFGKDAINSVKTYPVMSWKLGDMILISSEAMTIRRCEIIDLGDM